MSSHCVSVLTGDLNSYKQLAIALNAHDLTKKMYANLEKSRWK